LKAVVAAADGVVTVEFHPPAAATTAFRFPTIAAPSKSDAGTAARVRILSGQVDGNSGGPRKLVDGAGAQIPDDPGSSFFFQAGRSTRAGRILITLREPTEVQAIQTYSWHPGERGPQVYTVFGDADKADLPLPDRNRPDAAELGWVRIAAVDTRKTVNEIGGQYAVRIGGSIGRHKRLIFDVERTADNSQFAQTFFSEIDILDGKEYEAPAAAVAEIDWFDIGDKYRIGFDTSDAPDLKPWVDEKLKPVCATWYPKIVEMLPSDGYNAPEKFTITFHEDMEGVAHCTGTSIHCAARWYRTQLDKEGLGSIVHEMVHVVQQYGRLGSGRRNPGWLVEGLADYIRWYLYEPASVRRPPNPKTAKYTDSYRTTGAFLAYVADQNGGDVIKKLNAEMRNGTYTAETWTAVAGSTVDDLWAAYVKTLESR
ncbi:MAG TPA: basic secretory protein-like protein, partial [Caulifigura sp.]|nr:basic secretory protein-like protein [Caulifigura sp.]